MYVSSYFSDLDIIAVTGYQLLLGIDMMFGSPVNALVYDHLIMELTDTIRTFGQTLELGLVIMDGGIIQDHLYLTKTDISLYINDYIITRFESSTERALRNSFSSIIDSSTTATEYAPRVHAATLLTDKTPTADSLQNIRSMSSQFNSAYGGHALGMFYTTRTLDAHLLSSLTSPGSSKMFVEQNSAALKEDGLRWYLKTVSECEYEFGID